MRDNDITNAKRIRKSNKIQILNFIREHKANTRADAARLSGLSPPTITRLVDSLINSERLVRETGTGISGGGRRPKMLQFAGDDHFVIGIDLGTTHIHGILSDLNAEIIVEIKRPIDYNQRFDDIMDFTAKIINQLRTEPTISGKHIFGAGIAVVGLVNKSTNLLEYSSNFDWHDVDIKAAIAKRCDIPILIDNVTRMMAMGELYYGVGSRYKNFIFVNVGYGIGAGVILDGEPLFGSYGMAGEFGHITLDKDSDILCDCGNRGCLQALASGHAIERAAAEALMRHADSSMQKYKNGADGSISAEIVAQEAHRGDELALEIFNNAAEYLGIGIAGLINLFNPQAVVIGGGVAKASDLLFDTVRKTVENRTIQKISRNVELLPATFGSRSAAMGAVSVMLKNVLQLEPIS